MIPPSKKSPTLLALDIAASPKKGDPDGDGDLGSESPAEDAAEGAPSDPGALLDSIQANIDRLRAKLSA